MKIYLSASAFALGLLFFGVGHAIAVSVDSSGEHVMGSPGIVEVTEAAYDRDMFMLRDDNGEYEREVREKEESHRIDRDGDGRGDGEWDQEDRGGNELRELEQKLEKIYGRIKQLKQEAEKLHKLIAKKRGNKIMPPRPILPPEREMCTKEYAPVCGQIDTGIRCVTTPCPSTTQKTFSNSCEAAMNHAMVLYKRVCKKDSPEIDPNPRNEVMCTREYAPVCAAISESCGVGDQLCKGAQRTYSNRCEAKAHNAEFLYNGACNMGTKATRVNQGTKRRIYPAQRSRVMPDTGTMSGEKERPTPVLRQRMTLVGTPSLTDSTFVEQQDLTEQVQEKRTPVMRLGRWNKIMNFLRRR